MNVEIEYRLWKIRTDKGISSGQLAKLSGVGKTTINDIENGRHDPTVHTLCLLAGALDVAPEDLYTYRFIQ